MKFMMMMHHAGKGAYEMSSWSPKDIQTHIGFMKSFVKKLQAQGEFIAAEGLAHPGEAKLVRAGPNGEPQTDGVFPESKEFLVGFWIIDVESPQRAMQLAAEASAAPGPGGVPVNVKIEVRQVMSAPPDVG